MRLYSQKDVDKKALRGARIAVVGYGSQGRAHALNLKDSGFDVVVGVRKGGTGWKQARRDGQYTTSTRGRTLAEEGFIHAPTAGQVAQVADAAMRPRVRR